MCKGKHILVANQYNYMHDIAISPVSTLPRLWKLHKMVKHDRFCWVCCRPDTELKCSCRRTFHVNCAIQNFGINSLPDELDWCCSVCKQLASSRNTKAELQRIPVIVRIQFKPEHFDLHKSKMAKRKWKKIKAGANDVNLFASDVIVNPIDLQTIKAKAELYRSFDEFRADLQWFVHNFEVLFTGDHVRTKRAKHLFRDINDEIDSVKKCLHCHIHANEKETRRRWFTMVCDDPHLMIWAHEKKSRFLPAKLMSVHGQLVNVRFFGGYHKNQDVPIDECYLFSKESPYPLQEAQYKSCFAEADSYIANIEQKFKCKFKFTQPKTPIDPSLIDKYIRETIHDKIPNAISQIDDENGVDSSNLFHNTPDSNGDRQTTMEYVELDPGEVTTVDSIENDENNRIVQAAPMDDSDYDNDIMPNEQDANEHTNQSTHEHNGCDVEIDATNVSSDETVDIVNGITDSYSIDNADVSTQKQNVHSSMQNFMELFDRIRQVNAKLEKDLMESKKLHDQEVKGLKMAHEQELAQLKETHAHQLAKLTERMEHQSQQTLKNELSTLKSAHETEMFRFRMQRTKKMVTLVAENRNMIKDHRKLMGKKDEKHKRALSELKMNHLRLIDIAKRHVYCMGCDKSKFVGLYSHENECMQ